MMKTIREINLYDDFLFHEDFRPEQGGNRSTVTKRKKLQPWQIESPGSSSFDYARNIEKR